MTEEMSLTVFDPIRATLADLVKKNETLVFDHTTPAGETELRSWVKWLRGYKGDVARAHKDTKANALAFGRKVDAIKNELTAAADIIITERMKPLDEIEAKKRAEAEAIIEAERVAKEKAEVERLADLEKREAEATRKEAEIQKKEQAEREKQIAAEAVKDALKKAEADKQEAIKKAEREKAEAVKAEKEKARQAELDRIAVENIEKAVKEKQIAEEAKKAADKTHRSNVDAKIEMALRVITGDNEVASEITMALVNGKIPNITIDY